MEEGQKVSWRGINKDYSGTIVGRHAKGYFVRIDNTDKKVIVHPNSFIHAETDK